MSVHQTRKFRTIWQLTSPRSGPLCLRRQGQPWTAGLCNAHGANQVHVLSWGGPGLIHQKNTSTTSTNGHVIDVIIHRGEGKLCQTIWIGQHRLAADALPEAGGEGAGPEPHDLLAAALGACTALTVTMYARSKGYSLDDADVHIRHGQQAAGYTFTSTIRYLGELSEGEKARLTEVANKCPAHRTLQGQIQIVNEAA